MVNPDPVGSTTGQLHHNKHRSTRYNFWGKPHLPDGRKFEISETEWRPHQHLWEDEEVIRYLEIQGQPAVLYQPYSTGPTGEQVLPRGPALHWHAEHTEVTIFGELTHEEIIAIAESMREISH